MYTVTCDGQVIHNPAAGDPDLILVNGVVAKKANSADTFTFTIYPNHDYYSQIKQLASVICVYSGTALIFRGRVLRKETGWDNQQEVTCEGDYALFNDTVIHPYSFTGSVREYVNLIVNDHNSQVPAEKQVTVRTVTVTDPNNTIVRSSSDYAVTMQEIKDKLVDKLGGYMSVEYSGGRLYLDYLASSPSGTDQKVTLTKNLIDFAMEQNAESLATAIVPLGAKDEETGKRLTIKSVNDGKDYLVDTTAAAEYGLIFSIQTWDDVTQPRNLKAKGQARLSDLTRTLERITLTAVDLSAMDTDIEPLGILKTVTLEDDAHSASGQYVITERTYDLSHPENDIVTFGEEKATISGESARVRSVVSEMGDTIINQTQAAIDYITAKITGGAGGHLVIGYDSDGKPNEIYFLDTESVDTAVKVLRINMNGIGFSSSGVAGPYTTGWTLDGHFLADMIDTGTLNADVIRAGRIEKGTNYWDLDTGDVHIDASSIVTSSSQTVEEYLETLSDNGFIISHTGQYDSATSVTYTAKVYQKGEETTRNFSSWQFRWLKETESERTLLGHGYSITINPQEYEFGGHLVLEFTTYDNQSLAARSGDLATTQGELSVRVSKGETS